MALKKEAIFTDISTNTTSSVFRAGIKGEDVAVRVWGTADDTTAATVKMYGSTTNSTTQGIELATFTLDTGTADQAGTVLDVSWPFIYFMASSISRFSGPA